MYYRIFDDSPNVYPGYSYNLIDTEINNMAIYYLTSLADQELIETEEFKTKKALYENSESDIIISEIENYLSKFDGQLKVEISEESFDEAECDNIDEMNNRPWN